MTHNDLDNGRLDRDETLVSRKPYIKHGLKVPDKFDIYACQMVDLKPGSIDVDLYLVRGRVRESLEVTNRWTKFEGGELVEYFSVKWPEIDRLKWQKVNYRHKIAVVRMAMMSLLLDEVESVLLFRELDELISVMNWVDKQIGKLENKPVRQSKTSKPKPKEPEQTTFEDQCQ